MENYESFRKYFPSGYVSQFTANGTDTGPGWGWAALLLPMMEETNLSGHVELRICRSKIRPTRRASPRRCPFTSARPTIASRSGPP